VQERRVADGGGHVIVSFRALSHGAALASASSGSVPAAVA